MSTTGKQEILKNNKIPDYEVQLYMNSSWSRDQILLRSMGNGFENIMRFSTYVQEYGFSKLRFRQTQMVCG